MAGWLSAGLLFVLFAGLVLCWLKPALVLRLGLFCLGRSLFWLRHHSCQHVPRQGGVILVCHSLHGLDCLWLLAASPRLIRLGLCTGLAKTSWLARCLLRACGAVLLEGDAQPEDLDKFVQALRLALDRGEVVAIFAETVETAGGLSLTMGQLLDLLLLEHAVPIVPVCVDQDWGSLFRWSGGRLVWNWPQEVPYRIDVSFAAPLQSARGGEVYRAVQRLSAQAAVARNPSRPLVHRQLVRMAARHPFRACLIDNTMKTELTYGRTLAGVMCLKRALKPLLGDDAMIGVWLPPGIGGVLSNLALCFLGKVAVNLNYTTGATAVQSALNQCKSKHVITSKRFTQRVPLDAGSGVEVIYLEDMLAKITSRQKLLAFLTVVLFPGWVLEHWILKLGRHRTNDLATIIFSSGSTGDPKGVMLTHGNVSGNVESMAQVARFCKQDRVLGVLPFFHSFGYTVTLWTPLQVGASTAYHADPRQSREIGELARSQRSTIYLTTPTFLRFCLKKCDENDFRTVRLLICGAEKLSQSLARDFHERFGALPLEGYGCTELTPVTSTNLPDEELAGVRRILNRPGTIGPPIPGVAGRIVSPETDEELGTEEDGLLMVYGPNVMSGYLHRPEQTNQVLRDGWYLTGDMGRFDEFGHMILTGRLSRFAKVGGEMVPLERIEEELHAILQTSERVCAVTCVPDEARGERVVVLHLCQDNLEVTKWCKDLGSRGLPHLWMPAERDFIGIPELPVLGSGKVNLKRVKELALELARK